MNSQKLSMRSHRCSSRVSHGLKHCYSSTFSLCIDALIECKVRQAIESGTGLLPATERRLGHAQLATDLAHDRSRFGLPQGLEKLLPPRGRTDRKRTTTFPVSNCLTLPGRRHKQVDCSTSFLITHSRGRTMSPEFRQNLSRKRPSAS